jgi:hypothetical protein
MSSSYPTPNFFLHVCTRAHTHIRAPTRHTLRQTNRSPLPLINPIHFNLYDNLLDSPKQLYSPTQPPNPSRYTIFGTQKQYLRIYQYPLLTQRAPLSLSITFLSTCDHRTFPNHTFSLSPSPLYSHLACLNQHSQIGLQKNKQ